MYFYSENAYFNMSQIANFNRSSSINGGQLNNGTDLQTSMSQTNKHFALFCVILFFFKRKPPKKYPRQS